MKNSRILWLIIISDNNLWILCLLLCWSWEFVHYWILTLNFSYLSEPWIPWFLFMPAKYLNSLHNFLLRNLFPTHNIIYSFIKWFEIFCLFVPSFYRRLSLILLNSHLLSNINHSLIPNLIWWYLTTNCLILDEFSLKFLDTWWRWRIFTSSWQSEILLTSIIIVDFKERSHFRPFSCFQYPQFILMNIPFVIKIFFLNKVMVGIWKWEHPFVNMVKWYVVRDVLKTIYCLRRGNEWRWIFNARSI